MTPLDFSKNYLSDAGAGFSLAFFTQSAWFRFHNKSEILNNLYFCRSRNTSRSWIGVLSSAKVLEESAIVNSTRNIFKANSKSFFFAGLFLKKDNFKNIAILYEFCRYVDDIADKNYKHKNVKLNKVKKNLGNTTKNLKLIKIKKLIDKNIINKNYLLQLIDGVSLDISNEVRIESNKDLISYSYQVAGTVGLMMS